MHDHTCCFCAHTFTGRRRKFCYTCLPAHVEIEHKVYQDRYNGLSIACGFQSGAWHSKWEPAGGWPASRKEPRPDHQCAGCDVIVPCTRKWCSQKCAAHNKRHGVRQERLTSDKNKPSRRLSVASRSTAMATNQRSTKRESFLARCANLPALPNPCVKCGGRLVEWWTLGNYRDKRRCCYICYLNESADRHKRRPRAPAPRKIVNGICNNCGSEFMKSRAHRIACSDSCSKQLKRETTRRKNMRRRTANIGESYTIQELRQRDGDTCHICKKRINFDLSGMHPNGPNIDHLTPLADGGADCKSNVKMAHRSCNIKRGTGGIAQLLLIG